MGIIPGTRAVLFDFGGTLYTYAAAKSAREAVGAEFGQALGFDETESARVLDALARGSARAASEFTSRPFYMHREMLAWGYIYAAESLGRSIDYAEANRLFTRRFQMSMETSTLREGTIETLKALRQRGLHLGVVSNADEDQLEAMLAMGGVGDHFDSTLCSETARSCKPHPEIFHQALRQAGCAPAEAVFVGDTPDHDIAGAEAVGMRTVLILEHTEIATRSRTSTQRSDYVIRELPELLDILS